MSTYRRNGPPAMGTLREVMAGSGRAPLAATGQILCPPTAQRRRLRGHRPLQPGEQRSSRCLRPQARGGSPCHLAGFRGSASYGEPVHRSRPRDCQPRRASPGPGACVSAGAVPPALKVANSSSGTCPAMRSKHRDAARTEAVGADQQLTSTVIVAADVAATRIGASEQSIAAACGTRFSTREASSLRMAARAVAGSKPSSRRAAYSSAIWSSRLDIPLSKFAKPSRSRLAWPSR